jgi:hypothetical protein
MVDPVAFPLMNDFVSWFSLSMFHPMYVVYDIRPFYIKTLLF